MEKRPKQISVSNDPCVTCYLENEKRKLMNKKILKSISE